ncbi:MAG TPA: glycosyltransferase family 87 protein [Chloroflexota bacterium]|nr:glycosyltransferase family 87 protein [Chloroflexota bacterium]
MASLTGTMHHTEMLSVGVTRRNDRVLARLAAASAAAWIVTLGFIACALWVSWPGGVIYTDFVSYWTAASLLRQGDGASLYDMETQRAFQEAVRNRIVGTEAAGSAFKCNPFPNLPPLALPYVALTWLPMPVAHLLWGGVSLGVFVLAMSRLLRGRRNGRSIALIMLGFGAVTSTLLEGQAYALLLLIFAIGLMALVSDRPFLGGLLFGLLVVKPQYVVLFGLLFLIKGRWRELSGMAVGGTLVAGLSLVMVGPEGLVGFVGMLRDVGGFSASSVYPESMVNWRAILIHLWPGLSDSVGSALVLALGAGTVSLALVSWRGPWRPSSAAFLLQIQALLLASIIASPHSHFHGTVLLLAPLALLSGRLSELGPSARLWRPLLAVGYAMAAGLWMVAAWRWLMAPYLLLTLLVTVVQARAVSQHRCRAASQPLAFREAC